MLKFLSIIKLHNKQEVNEKIHRQFYYYSIVNILLKKETWIFMSVYTIFSRDFFICCAHRHFLNISTQKNLTWKDLIISKKKKKDCHDILYRVAYYLQNKIHNNNYIVTIRVTIRWYLTIVTWHNLVDYIYAYKLEKLWLLLSSLFCRFGTIHVPWKIQRMPFFKFLCRFKSSFFYFLYTQSFKEKPESKSYKLRNIAKMMLSIITN